MATTDVCYIPNSSASILNGNVVTQPTLGAFSSFKDKNVDTDGTDNRGAAPTDTDLESNYTNRFDDPRYYTGDAVT